MRETIEALALGAIVSAAFLFDIFKGAVRGTVSILPNSSREILEPPQGAYGILCVKWLADCDSHALFLDSSIIAMHHNGFSCHNLAVRILAAWSGEKPITYALDQFDYILQCGGVGKSRESVEYIAGGFQQ